MTHLRQAMLDELQRRNYATTTVQYYMFLNGMTGTTQPSDAREACAHHGQAID